MLPSISASKPIGNHNKVAISSKSNKHTNSTATESKPLSSISAQMPNDNGKISSLSSISAKCPSGNDQDLNKNMQSTIATDSKVLSSCPELIDKYFYNFEDCPTVYDISQSKISLLPFIEVKTSHSERPLKFLIDTGSSICLVKKSSLSKEPILESDIVKFKGINDVGSFAETKGRFTLSIQHENATASFPFHFHVVSNVNLDYDGIIGTNFLSTYKASILYTDSKLQLITENPFYFELKIPSQMVYTIPARCNVNRVLSYKSRIKRRY